METKRRKAQLGLFAASILLLGCLSVLFVQDRAAAKGTTPMETTKTSPTVSQPTMAAANTGRA